MKKLFLASVALVTLVAGPALSADLPTKAPALAPAPPPLSWTGLYIGANGGCALSSHSGSAAVNDSDPGEGSFFALDFRNGGGCFGGGQVGFNYQLSNNVVLGVEADWQGSSIDGRGTLFELEPGEQEVLANYTYKISSFGTVRGRIGYAFYASSFSWLPYITGGWAWGRAKVSSVTCIAGDCTGPLNFSDSQTLNGWTVGAGVETAVNNNWSVKFEYLYVDLGSKTFNAFASDDGAPFFPVSVDAKIHAFRLGANYKFGWLR